MNSIKCPHCGHLVEVTTALKSQIEHEVLANSEEKHKKALDEARKLAEEDAAKKIKNQFELQIKRAQEDTLEKDTRIKELIEQMNALMGEMRQMRKEKDEVKMEMQKKLLEEEEKIRIDATKKAEQGQMTRIQELEKQKIDALKEVEDMKRKLQQGSQQAQGEVFELEFETLLHQQYPNDKIEPVGKGVRGGDVIQEVWDSRGNYAGKILWELKNTKTWSEGWIDKLKSDQRAIKAEEAVIITLAMPPGMQTAGFRNQVWVTNREFVVPLADSLRAKLIQLFYIKASTQGKDEKIEILYNYLSGTEFKHRVEAIVDAFSNMQSEIEKEKRYFMNKWARDEKNIRQVIDNTYGMHGDLKGIIGTSLPAIAGIDDDLLTDTLDQTSEITTRRDGIKLTLQQKVTEPIDKGEQPIRKKQSLLHDDDNQTLF